MSPEAAIERFVEKAEAKGLSFVRRSSDAVEVQNPDGTGFPVALYIEQDLTVAAGDWHDHFEDGEDALDCCAFLLSDQCRLKTIYRGNSFESCTVQSNENGDWRDVMKFGVFFVPFWKPKRVEYMQNTTIWRDEMPN